MKFKKFYLWSLILITAGVAISTSACSSKSSEKLVVSTFGLSTKQMRSDVLNPFSKNITSKSQLNLETVQLD